MYGVHFYVMQGRLAAAPADSRRETDAAGAMKKALIYQRKSPA